MSNGRHRKCLLWSTRVLVYSSHFRWTCCFFLQLVTHQSHTVSLPPGGRFWVKIWFVEEIILKNLIYRQKHCWQIKGYFYHKVTESKLWLLVPLVSHTCCRHLSKTRMQHLYRCLRVRTEHRPPAFLLHQQPLKNTLKWSTIFLSETPRPESQTFCLGVSFEPSKHKLQTRALRNLSIFLKPFDANNELKSNIPIDSQLL